MPKDRSRTPAAALVLCLALVAGCATTPTPPNPPPLVTISTERLQKDWLRAVLHCDGIADAELFLHPKLLAVAPVPPVVDSAFAGLVANLRTELREASVVGTPQDVLTAYGEAVDAFHSALSVAVAADGAVSACEDAAVSDYIERVLPALEHGSAKALRQQIAYQASESSIRRRTYGLRTTFWELVRRDLLLADGLSQSELDYLISARLIVPGEARTYLELNHAQWAKVLAQPRRAQTLRLTKGLITRYAPFLRRSHDHSTPLRQALGHLQLDEGLVTEAEFARYNWLAQTLSAAVAAQLDPPPAPDAAPLFAPLLRDAALMTVHDPSDAATPEALTGEDVELVFFLDLWRADRFDPPGLRRHFTRGRTRLAYLRAQSFLEQRQDTWGRAERQALLLRSLRGAFHRPVSLRSGLLKGWVRLLAADGQFSSAERARLADYAYGFGAGEPTRAQLLAQCDAESGATDPATCRRHAAAFADAFAALSQQLDRAENPIAEALAATQAVRAQVARNHRRVIEGELITNLRTLRQAQERYLIKHAAAQAAAPTGASGQAPELPRLVAPPSAQRLEPRGAAQARQHFAPTPGDRSAPRSATPSSPSIETASPYPPRTASWVCW